jgi:hypothetical protein
MSRSNTKRRKAKKAARAERIKWIWQKGRSAEEIAPITPEQIMSLATVRRSCPVAIETVSPADWYGYWTHKLR